MLSITFPFGVQIDIEFNNNDNIWDDCLNFSSINAFEYISMWSIWRIRFEFDQVIPGQEKPTEVLVLDGNSLTTSDLVKCEQGKCIIKVSLYPTLYLLFIS